MPYLFPRMKRDSRLFFLILLAITLMVGAYSYRRGKAAQAGRLRTIAALETQVAANNRQSALANVATGRRIALAVCRNRHQARDVQVLAQTQRILQRTQALADTLYRLRAHLRAAPTLAQLTGPLDRYARFIQQFVYATPSFTEPSAVITATGWFDQPDVSGSSPGAQATITQLEAQLRNAERAALLTQAVKVGSSCICFDKIQPLAVPVAATVAPGDYYRAQLFLTSSGLIQGNCYDYIVNGALLTEHSGPGMLVRFVVPGARTGQPDTTRAKWQGIIRGGYYPADTVFSVTVPYLIVQRSGK